MLLLQSHQWGSVCCPRDTGHWQSRAKRIRVGCGQCAPSEGCAANAWQPQPLSLTLPSCSRGFHPPSSSAPQIAMHTRSSAKWGKKATSQERSHGKVMVFPGQFCHVSAESLGCYLPTSSSPVSMEVSQGGLWVCARGSCWFTAPSSMGCSVPC